MEEFYLKNKWVFYKNSIELIQRNLNNDWANAYQAVYYDHFKKKGDIPRIFKDICEDCPYQLEHLILDQK